MNTLINKRRLLAAAVMIALPFGAASAAETIKIGGIAPLSPPGGVQTGESLRDGRKVAVDTFVVPATVAVDRALDKHKVGSKTLRQVFSDAGAKLGPASCAACLGGPVDTFGRLNEPKVCISTTNRNFPGRMGHAQSSVFLASPLTAAASAVTGRITDPREFLK